MLVWGLCRSPKLISIFVPSYENPVLIMFLIFEELILSALLLVMVAMVPSGLTTIVTLLLTK